MRHSTAILMLILIITLNVWFLKVKSQEKTVSHSPAIITEIQRVYLRKKGESPPNIQNRPPYMNSTNNPSSNYNFEDQVVSFTGNFSDYGSDTDSDGLYNHLVIEIEVYLHEEEGGEFRFTLTLINNTFGISFTKTKEYSLSTLGNGPSILGIPILIEASYLYKQLSSCESTTFIFQVSYVQMYQLGEMGGYTFEDGQAFNYSTREYSLEEFEFDPFPINGDVDFAFVANFEGWPGHGISNNPYIIDGLILNASRDNPFEIRNTNIHFSISNCVVTGGRTGIKLENVTNAKILNNSISDNDVGIYLQLSNSITVTHNRIYKNAYGINVGSFSVSTSEPSNNNSIINNLINHNREYGILIDCMSRFNLVQENNFLDNNVVGSSQACDQSWDNSFKGNYWSNHGEEVERYLIEGTTQNEDLTPSTTPNHLTSPEILTPNEGEVFRDNLTIRWRRVCDSFNQNIQYSLYYSPNAGETWQLLSQGPFSAFEDTDIENETDYCKFNWKVEPFFPMGSDCLIRIVANDTFGYQTIDTSDSFKIEKADTSQSHHGVSFSSENVPHFPILPVFSFGSILVFMATLFIVIRRQQMK